MAASREEELRELRLMEERLLKERQECEVLEDQIKALATASGGSIAVLGDAPAPGPDDAGGGSGSGSDDGSRSRSHSPGASGGARGGKGGGKGGGEASNAHRRGTTQIRQDYAAAAAGGRAGHLAAAVEIDRTADVQVPQTRLTGAVPARVLREQERRAKFMSPMYRSAVPARGKQGERTGVVISNFSRAPRFKEDKAWVPGPGQYATHDTDFSPVTVASRPDEGGKYGHTWQEQQKSLKVLAAATAFNKAGEDAVAQRDARDKEAAEVAADNGGGGGGGGTDGLSPRRKGASARAYDASVKREKELSRQLAVAHRTISQLRMNVTSYQSQAREQMTEMRKRMEVAQSRQAASHKKLKRWREAHGQLERANFALQKAVRDNYAVLAGSVASDRFAQVSRAAQAVDDAMTAAAPLVARAGDSEATSVAEDMVSSSKMSAFAKDLGAVPEVDLDMADDPRADPRAGMSAADWTKGTGASTGGDAPLIGTNKPTSLGELGLDLSDIKSFTKKTRRQSTMIMAREQEAARASAQMEQLERYYGTTAKDAGRELGRGALRTDPTKGPGASRGTGIGQAAGAPSPPGRGRGGGASSGGGGARGLDIISEEGGGVPVTRRGTPGAGGGAAASAASGRKFARPQKPKKRMSIMHAHVASAAGEEDDDVGDLGGDELKPSEATLDEKLRHIFEYYCSFGDRGNVLFLSSSKFFKFVREAEVLRDGKLTAADVDIVFNKIAAETAADRAHGDVGGAGTNKVHKGARLEYGEFTAALSMLAQRKFGTSAPSALKQLLTAHVVPMYERLRRNATFVHDIVKSTREQDTAEFADKFLQPDVLAFFNDNRVALEHLFTRYAMMDAPRHVASQGWAEVREAHTQMSLKMYLRWSQDFRFMPELLSRPELIQVFKEANQGSMSDGDPTALSYPEFIEVLGLMAMHLYRDDEDCPTTLSKIQNLIFKMHERAGVKFAGEEMKLVRTVQKQVQATLTRLHKDREARAAGFATAHRTQVSDLLRGTRVVA